MKVLVVGGGGREHALAWKIAADSVQPELFCAPGNAGTEQLGINLPIKAEDIEGLLAWAQEKRPDLTVVGPEAPLCAGLVDRFAAAGLKVFGPGEAAARIEGSKVFAKEVMLAAGVPTAPAQVFADADAAVQYIRAHGAPVVVKADGLAAGKGVTVCHSVEEAEAAVRACMIERVFGAAGERILVEECLEGEEASILALVDGEQVVLLASSQDHKRVFDGDRGPNTGGMGAYSPAPVVEPFLEQIKEDIFKPTIAELERRGIDYRGVLYAGLMITPDGPYVLEFNCRFGDPETQAIIPRWEGDILPALWACVEGNLRSDMVGWKPESCVTVVIASGGYPGKYEKGKEIQGIAEAEKLEGVIVFHAGTTMKNGVLVTAGGRVLGVTALGRDLESAVERAYEAVSRISFEDMHYRKDIACRALARRVG